VTLALYCYAVTVINCINCQSACTVRAKTNRNPKVCGSRHFHLLQFLTSCTFLRRNICRQSAALLATKRLNSPWQYIVINIDYNNDYTNAAAPHKRRVTPNHTRTVYTCMYRPNWRTSIKYMPTGLHALDSLFRLLLLNGHSSSSEATKTKESCWSAANIHCML